ncbi:MAG TPA: acylphosphatase [Usitatibacter sp.]|nr:acylphosphatase [Usitatibacter sp.]
MSDPLARRLSIRGRVQGVFFRESMRQEAARLGVTGWVRNRRDGSVEAVVQGGAEAVDAMVRWAQRGPRDAEVAAVEVSPVAAGEFSGFDKRPTD